jgi:multidrug efflux pump subunit AcrA (membrane-fusion protein)
MVNAAIRAQVTGYLLTQDYSEGSFVKKGQLLFQIDPRPLHAAADQGRGQLAQANLGHESLALLSIQPSPQWQLAHERFLKALRQSDLLAQL